MRDHATPLRGSERVMQSPLNEGRFGRMFRRLPAASFEDHALSLLAASMKEPVPQPQGWDPQVVEDLDNPAIPSGYTYFGQFIDHDITFDAASSLDRANDPDALVSFRTPRFDLDSVYGSGPLDEPFQYEGGKGPKLLVDDSNQNGVPDLPRNEQGFALIGDPRNDEHAIISQLHLAFIRLHNKLVDHVVAQGVQGEQAFAEAQRLTRWHYQWVVVHDFLPRLLDPNVLASVFPPPKQGAAEGQDIRRRYYKPKKNAYIPLEFSVAAFRFGHSMVRGRYDLNDVALGKPIFLAGDNIGATDDLRGRKPLEAQWTIDWSRFFVFGGSTPQPSRKIDARLVEGLFDLPGPDATSLPLRNLRTGQARRLPSGQDVAQAVRAPVLTGAELGADVPVPTPLWFYILQESHAVHQGTRLGPVGSRIVAEVLLGILELDPQSYYRQQPTWVPDPVPGTGDAGRVTLPDLLVFGTT